MYEVMQVKCEDSLRDAKMVLSPDVGGEAEQLAAVGTTTRVVVLTEGFPMIKISQRWGLENED